MESHNGYMHVITRKGSVYYASITIASTVNHSGAVRSSPGNLADDYIRKLYYYKTYGVREYWIVDPRRKTVTVNYFEGNIVSVQYPFDSIIKVNIYDDLLINFSEIADMLNI